MSFNAGAAALESARTNAEAAIAARVVLNTLRAALAHGLRAGGLLQRAPRSCATARWRSYVDGGGSMRRHARWTGSGRHRFDDRSLVQQQVVEEKERRNEVEAIFRMMDTNSDGYLSVEVGATVRARARASSPLSLWRCSTRRLFAARLPCAAMRPRYTIANIFCTVKSKGQQYLLE
jgi:hypothetical protein